MSATGGQVAAAMLVPPLGVYLRRGGGRPFWTAAALTLLAWVPGVVFALWTVLRREGDASPARG
ncbi:Uncharacterized membrane protein YqaE, homolog of Blt101, UPF0057 family [Sphingomonas guangdongensis]|uniref:Uncharacterized membrane protein YqaE, homolog of Blt101, UPF0057 family n=1 Tax=Sphingomonas guangdongensis TaxID=1141890 RepID=A0A285QGG0_9SPHN|nr:YqaE/Pmp3 family membrane protein [Sphingomonas guangdongensis]SOB81030.1 Uncharacterized membrane protein YqaE, homolog of Blt101, UPF0057 family [Sphingomonas guangdongensis]